MTQLSYRPLPTVEHAERALVGLLLDSPAIAYSAAADLPVDAWTDYAHREIVDVCRRLVRQGSTVDAVTVADALPPSGYVAERGGEALLAELLNTPPPGSADRATEYAAQVRSAYVDRQVIQALPDLTEDAYRGGGAAQRVSDRLQQIASQAGTDRRPTAAIRTLDTVEERELRWLWPARIPRQALSLIFGEPGVSKSLLTLAVAAAITRGADWPDGTPGLAAPGNVLLIASEDPVAEVLLPRFRAAGGDLSRLSVLDGRAELGRGGEQTAAPWTYDDLDTLRDAIEQTQPEWIVIDPAGDYLPSASDQPSDHEIRRYLQPIGRLAREYDLGCTLVAHTRKSRGGTALDAVLGSRGWGGLCRTATCVGRDPDDEGRVVAAQAKSNWGGHDTPGLAYRVRVAPGETAPHLEWLREPVDVSADDLLAERTSKRKQPSGPSTEDVVERLVRPHDPILPGALRRQAREAYGLSASDVDDLVQAAVHAGAVYRCPSRGTYSGEIVCVRHDLPADADRAAVHVTAALHAREPTITAESVAARTSVPVDAARTALDWLRQKSG